MLSKTSHVRLVNTQTFESDRNPDEPDSSLQRNTKLSDHERNPELQVKVTMTRMRRLFRNAFHNPTETQSAGQGAENPFVTEAVPFIHQPHDAVLCCVALQ